MIYVKLLVNHEGEAEQNSLRIKISTQPALIWQNQEECIIDI